MNQFDRLLKIISKDEFKKIQETKILLVGVGGVGGYALESLVRMGFIDITIIDCDTVDETNLNRQIISLHSNIGEKKVDVALNRCLDINPLVRIKTKDIFLTKENLESELDFTYDYIIDACDTVSVKLTLVLCAKKYNNKIISIMGTGNKFDPTKIVITDIYKTQNDPLAKVMRKLLKENGIKKLPVVASLELPIKNCSRTPGSTSLVPSVAGIYATSYIVNDLLKKYSSK